MEILLEDITIVTRPSEDSLFITPMWRGYRAGIVDCSFLDNGMLVGNLQVFDDVPMRWSICSNPLAFIPRYCQQINFQNHHIGTMLLKRVILEAEKAGVEKSTGRSLSLT